jgi:protocatechuate 3,4-dioxygenase, alpha subunit
VPGLTPFQTTGPFFHFALPYRGGDTLADETTPGERIIIEGTVRDGEGAPVPDALIEIWQADASGRYHHPDDERGSPGDGGFDGFGRTPTDAGGQYTFTTIKPGGVPAPDGRVQARHVLFSILGRGILTRFVTRMYFEDDESTTDDPILECVPAARRGTLVARRVGEGRYRFDLVLQGPDETVFFDV